MARFNNVENDPPPDTTSSERGDMAAIIFLNIIEEDLGAAAALSLLTKVTPLNLNN